jgi:hypothetical protein
MPQICDALTLQALVGTWAPLEAGDSNVKFTVTFHGGTVRVLAVDAYDGEVLKVTGVVQTGNVIRFSTLTPSTGATVDHELEALPGEQARYRFTVAQTWQRLSPPAPLPTVN